MAGKRNRWQLFKPVCGRQQWPHNPVLGTQASWHLNNALGPFVYVASGLKGILSGTMEEARPLGRFWTSLTYIFYIWFFLNKTRDSGKVLNQNLWFDFCVFHSFWFYCDVFRKENGTVTRVILQISDSFSTMTFYFTSFWTVNYSFISV